MRLARIGAPGQERPAVWDGTVWRDLSGIVAEVDGDLLSAGLHDIHAALVGGDLPTLNPVRFGAPLGRIGKIICIGLNYRDHAEETGATPPTEPVVFMKAPDTVIGPDDDVYIPRGSAKTDWEVELGAVIGQTARYLA
ncbi:MAG: hypothetical protein QOC66_1607, partial [Pseudonocardiales bacterium]|nr:hypothetical protein [Pseudonocardiales bacterium]